MCVCVCVYIYVISIAEIFKSSYHLLSLTDEGKHCVI